VSKSLRSMMTEFARDRNGATAIEYGLLVALIGIGVLISASLLRGGLSDFFQGTADKFAVAIDESGV
jgi:pilus assembly protein Flp/PilA